MSLEDVKVGDIVIMSDHWGRELREVVKITPSGMIDVKLNSHGATRRFNKDGSERGGRTWYRTSIRTCTEEEAQQVRSEKRKAWMVRRIKSFAFEKLELEDLENIYKIMKVV